MGSIYIQGRLGIDRGHRGLVSTYCSEHKSMQGERSARVLVIKLIKRGIRTVSCFHWMKSFIQWKQETRDLID